MNFHFHIHYKTRFGQQLAINYWYVDGQIPEQLLLNTYDGANWMGVMEIEGKQELYYEYLVVETGNSILEYGPARVLTIDTAYRIQYIRDQWRSRSHKKNIFNSSAFKNILLPRKQVKLKTKKARKNKLNYALQLNVLAPDIPANARLGITGNIPALGNWDIPLVMEDGHFPNWQITIPLEQTDLSIEYKFVLCKLENTEILDWESGENRNLKFNFPANSSCLLRLAQEGFRFAGPWWRGAGMAIPIFSLRSQKGLGIGEFSDLIPLIDFSNQAGLKVIQVLPVNDTIATKTWADSYPYAAISVFALHPLYINISEVGKFDNKKDQLEYKKVQHKLNALVEVDFESVLAEKFKFLNILYKKNHKDLFSSKAYKAFFQKNKHWLIPYAAFCHFRDLYGTPDFNKWSDHQKYDQATILALSKPKSKAHSKLAFYFFIQFHADKQLKAARAYGQQKGVVLKGDLPIGIYRFSADAWIAPDLYNMDEQAGAPPDDYAVLGQNWGFPTYNWMEMAKDNFGWWQQRMQQLAEYFDALRIDHILGFFRIWQIPLGQISGTLGLFNPRKPYTAAELAEFGLLDDLDRYTKPFIRSYFLAQLFGEQVDWVKKTFLDSSSEDAFELKNKFQTQAQVKEYFEDKVPKKYQPLLASVLQLASEVLLIKEENGAGYNPRITLNTTHAYRGLSEEKRGIFDRIYHDYYYVRHDDFWRTQALWKLPALLDATDMLICGEDLGMIPASVPGVMDQLNIIPLEIQRMSKGNSAFGVPHQYAYFSVCSPSCHDMSTIRGWWEGDHSTAQRFYNEHLKRFGEAPLACNSELVTTINQEHLDAPSILAIFPIQDLVGMDDDLKRKDAFSEQINEPSNPDHYWRYRFHLNIEELTNNKEWLFKIAEMIKRSDR